MRGAKILRAFIPKCNSPIAKALNYFVAHYRWYCTKEACFSRVVKVYSLKRFCNLLNTLGVLHGIECLWVKFSFVRNRVLNVFAVIALVFKQYALWVSLVSVPIDTHLRTG